MKSSLLAAAALCASLALTGCASLQDSIDKASELSAHVRSLKTNGCESVPDEIKKVLVAAIKQKVERYPDNGICDPDWVRDVLIKELGLMDVDSGVDETQK